MKDPIIINSRLRLYANLECGATARMETDEGLPFTPDHLMADYQSDKSGTWYLTWVELNGPAIRKDGTTGMHRRRAYWDPDKDMTMNKWTQAPGWLVAYAEALTPTVVIQQLEGE